MMQDPKLTEQLTEILDLAHENGILTDVIVTAMEQALKYGWDSSKEPMDQRIVDIFEVSAYFEHGLGGCGIGPHGC